MIDVMSGIIKSLLTKTTTKEIIGAFRKLRKSESFRRQYDNVLRDVATAILEDLESETK